MKVRKNLSQAELMILAIGLTGSLLLSGCTTLPSCAWGKCAYPRSPALAPQMSERVYPLQFVETYEAVKAHLVTRGYPLARIDDDLIETEPYAEKEFARLLGLQYRWQVQVRKMDRLNTAVLPRLFLHESGKPPRELSPGLWPEAYRFFYHEIEHVLLEMRESKQS
ncbi:MAG: hypothetical protein ACREQA_11250 [Candidatus Binatia bacterium]